MSVVRDSNHSADASGNEDTEWIVCDNDIDISDPDNNPVMSQSYIDIGATTSPLYFAPYSPELEFTNIDRSLDTSGPLLTSPDEHDGMKSDIKSTTEDEAEQEPDIAVEGDTDKNEPMPWWRRVVTFNGIGLAAVAVGAASVLAIAATRSSHK